MNTSDLRGVITERLGSATREVLAAVEETVAGYEQEATGFRREIDRQRRQLELLQPQVKLRRGANKPIPDLQSQEEEGGEEEEQQPSGEAAESRSRPGSLSDEGAEPTTTFRLNQEHLKDKHYGKPPRKRLAVSKFYNLRAMITELLRRAARDVLAAVEGTAAWNQEDEASFGRDVDGQRRQLELLLVSHQQADVPTQEVEVVVEEEEQQQLAGRTGLETGSRRTRTRTRTRTSSQSDQLLGSGVDGAEGLLLNDEGDGGDEEPVNASWLKQEDLTDPDYEIPSRSTRVRGHPGGRRPGRPRLSGSADHLALRVRILEDSRTRVLSKAVFQRSAVLDLQCPRGLSELGFLDLLRSRCPLLADGRPFDVFIAAKNRRLQPLAAQSLTPEQICCGHSSGGNPTLYIRLKDSEDPSSSDAAAMKRDKTDLHSW